VPDAVRFCDECKPSRADGDGIKTHTTGYDETQDALRKSGRWQRLRARVIREQPLCARCQLRLSEIVDHIVPAAVAIAQAHVSGRYPVDKHAGYFLRSNLQGLCRRCHADETAEDKTHAGEWPDVVAVEAAAPKRKWTF
jgi:5-methylcytosine-specific restriction endonuclease McrA